MQTTLTADHIQKKYASHLALQDASLKLHQGEILALLGPNGAGKTTLIKILATLLNKDAGKVEILGYDLDRYAETIRHLVGYVGQDTERSAYARLTVWENLQFFGALRGMDKSQVQAQASRLVDYFEFHGQMERLFGSLSGGQKQTVVILRALLHDPPLIFLDEPTKGLDPLISRRIRSFLKRYVHEQGKSLLLTSHVLSEVDELADQVARIVRSLRTLELRKAPSVSETLDWARTLVLLGVETIDAAGAKDTLHILLKYQADIERATKELLSASSS